jgi:hypothetical protein
MSCAAFDVLAVRLARGEKLPRGLREEALAHARACARCAARQEDERAVTEALAALAARTAGAEAPARVELALRRALRETEKGEHRRRRHAGLVRSAKLALLATAAVVAVLAIVPRARPPAGNGAATRSSSPPPAAAVAAGVGSEFVSLGYGEDLQELDAFQVVRVELPRTALAAFGWPAGDAQAGAVTAEVILGHDGVARAIRLVE